MGRDQGASVCSEPARSQEGPVAILFLESLTCDNPVKKGDKSSRNQEPPPTPHRILLRTNSPAVAPLKESPAALALRSGFLFISCPAPCRSGQDWSPQTSLQEQRLLQRVCTGECEDWSGLFGQPAAPEGMGEAGQGHVCFVGHTLLLEGSPLYVEKAT